MEPNCLLFKNILRALDDSNCNYEFNPKRRFFLYCSFINLYDDSLVEWEIELCKINRANKSAIRFKRLSGTSKAFKEITNQISFFLNSRVS